MGPLRHVVHASMSGSRTAFTRSCSRYTGHGMRHHVASESHGSAARACRVSSTHAGSQSATRGPVQREDRRAGGGYERYSLERLRAGLPLYRAVIADGHAHRNHRRVQLPNAGVCPPKQGQLVLGPIQVPLRLCLPVVGHLRPFLRCCLATALRVSRFGADSGCGQSSGMTYSALTMVVAHRVPGRGVCSRFTVEFLSCSGPVVVDGHDHRVHNPCNGDQDVEPLTPRHPATSNEMTTASSVTVMVSASSGSVALRS